MMVSICFCILGWVLISVQPWFFLRVKVEIVIVQLQLKILKNFNYVLTIVICCYIMYSDIIKEQNSGGYQL